MNDVIMDEKIIEKYNPFWKDENSNEYSYVYMRKVFLEEDAKICPDYDKIALYLYAYLASWGMLRNSFLASKNYKVFIPVIIRLHTFHHKKELMNVEYGNREKYDIYILYIKEISDLISEALMYENDYCKFSGCEVSNKTINKPTRTLVSKIILGTYGCIPAFDSKFEIGWKTEFPKIRKYDEILKGIFCFINNNINMIDKECRRIKCGEYYTPARIVDIYFWIKGKCGVEEEKK